MRGQNHHHGRGTKRQIDGGTNRQIHKWTGWNQYNPNTSFTGVVCLNSRRLVFSLKIQGTKLKNILCSYWESRLLIYIEVQLVYGIIRVDLVDPNITRKLKQYACALPFLFPLLMWANDNPYLPSLKFYGWLEYLYVKIN